MKTPILLRACQFLPLRVKHWLRVKAQMAEFWSVRLVLSEQEQTELVTMTENCETPDFAEFDRRLQKIRDRWGIHDAHLEGMAVARRLMEFKRTHMRKP